MYFVLPALFVVASSSSLRHSGGPALEAADQSIHAADADTTLRTAYEKLVSMSEKVRALREDAVQHPKEVNQGELAVIAKQISGEALRLERRARIVLGAQLKVPPQSHGDSSPLEQLNSAHNEILEAAASVELVRQHSASIKPEKLAAFVATVKEEPKDMEAEIAEAKEDKKQLEEAVEKTEDKVEAAKEELAEAKKVEEKAENIVEKIEANETKAEEKTSEEKKPEEAKPEKAKGNETLGNETKVNETEAKLNETKAEEAVEEAKEDLEEAVEKHEDAKEVLDEAHDDHKELKTQHKTLVSTGTMAFFVVVFIVIGGCLYTL